MYVSLYAKKNLDHLANYIDLSAAKPDASAIDVGIKLQDSEKLIGIYENLPGEPTDRLLISNLGIHFHRSGQIDFFRYDEIDKITEPNFKKENFNELYIHLKDGRIIELPIRGRTERNGRRFLDAYSFSQFLHRVMGPKERRDFYR